MSGYSNMNESELFWNPQEDPRTVNQYYESDYDKLKSQSLDFQTFGDGRSDPNEYYTPPMQYNPASYDISPLNPQYSQHTGRTEDFLSGNEPAEFDEPPLLEELEIYPDRIVEKTLAVLNPFRGHSLADDSDFLSKDTDLAGPLTFCLILAVCLFVSGNKAHFGYIYGLSAMSCLIMYCLLSLMTATNGLFTLSNVASILGYCLLPIVGLSGIGIISTLHGPIGIVTAFLGVLWASLSASRLFVVLSGDHEQRPLIAYPCALVYGVFALLVVF